MQVAGKKKIAIDIKKHERTFINYAGQEISREEALTGRSSSPQNQQEDAGSQKEN